MTTRQTQLRQAKQRQRERERTAGLGVYPIKLPRPYLERLKAGMRDPRFVQHLCAFLDHEMVRIADYPALRLICWNTAATYLARADTFALYERNWRHIDVGGLTDEERAFIDTLAAQFGNGLINA